MWVKLSRERTTELKSARLQRMEPHNEENYRVTQHNAKQGHGLPTLIVFRCLRGSNPTQSPCVSTHLFLHFEMVITRRFLSQQYSSWQNGQVEEEGNGPLALTHSTTT